MVQLADIKLIKRKLNGRDRLGQATYTETSKDAVAEIIQISRSEFFQAGQIGITPDYGFKVSSFDYDDEVILEFKGQRRRIYRSYRPDPNTIELYTELATGYNEEVDDDDN